MTEVNLTVCKSRYMTRLDVDSKPGAFVSATPDNIFMLNFYGFFFSFLSFFLFIFLFLQLELQGEKKHVINV
jgi:hypothetical protein